VQTTLPVAALCGASILAIGAQGFSSDIISQHRRPPELIL
jgi:hypothetical protein